jgi:hypothetical protein
LRFLIHRLDSKQRGSILFRQQIKQGIWSLQHIANPLVEFPQHRLTSGSTDARALFGHHDDLNSLFRRYCAASYNFEKHPQLRSFASCTAGTSVSIRDSPEKTGQLPVSMSLSAQECAG